jgi:phage tail-like protein
MPQFTVNAHRLDAYKNFKFLVMWDGRIVAGVSRVSALVRNTDVIEYRVGGEPSVVRKMPGRTTFEPITLERGVTHDIEFERWAAKVWNIDGGLGQEVSLRDFRKDLRLLLLNEAGQVVKAWRIYRCWVSSYQALPDLDANSNGVAIEAITLQNEGWERDPDVVEPAEPTLDPVGTAPAPPPPAPPPPAPPPPPPPTSGGGKPPRPPKTPPSGMPGARPPGLVPQRPGSATPVRGRSPAKADRKKARR